MEGASLISLMTVVPRGALKALACGEYMAALGLHDCFDVLVKGNLMQVDF